jgi:hypothetical protein
MAVILQIVSPLDQSTVLLDLNDPTATNSTSLVPYLKTEVFSDVAFGAPVLDASQVDPANLDTTFTTFSRRAAAPVKIGLHVTASSTDNLTKVVGTLAQYLSQGCVMKWIPTGSVFTQFLDVLPSTTPVLLNGQAMALQQLALLADTQNDLTIEFTRQAYLRSAKLDPALNKLVTNPTLLRDSNQDGTPDGWTLTSTPTVSIVTATESCHIVAGAAARGVFEATAAASFASGDSGTAAIDVKVTSGTVAVILDWRTAADATISNVTTTTTSAGWTRIASSGTAPGTTDHIRFRVESSGAAATFDVRNAQVEKTATASPFRVCAETVALDPATAGMATNVLVYNPGTAWAPLEITESFPDASTAVQQASFALMSSSLVPGVDFIADYLNGPYYGQAEANGNGWTLTAGVNTTLAGAVDANASPGSGTSVARISHTTGPNTTQLGIRWSRSTLLDCLRGTFRVFVRVKPVVSANAIYDLSIKWGTGGTVQTTNDTYVLDNSLSAATAYRKVYLGDVVLPDDFTSPTISSLQIELWTNMDGSKTAQNLDVDYLQLVPTEDVAALSISALSADSIYGASLGLPFKLGAPVTDPTWTAGTPSGTFISLAAVNAAAAWGGSGTAGITGFFTGTGGIQHTCTADMSLIPSATMTVNFQLVHFDSGTGANPVVDASVSTTTTIVKHWQPKITASDTAGKLYQLRVTYTSGSGGAVNLASLTHSVTPVVIQNQKIRTDPGSVPPRYAAEQLDSSGNLVVTMNASRIPFWVPPGLSCVTVDTWDKQSDSNDLELAHINARTLSLLPAVYARNWV